MAVIEKNITLGEVRAAKPEMIWYGALTCWWTHDPAHICTHPESGLPCDPRGGPLFETGETEAFLIQAEENPSKYGAHGIDAFVAAHHLNCRVSEEDRRSTCLADWDQYNRLLDEQKGFRSPPSASAISSPDNRRELHVSPMYEPRCLATRAELCHDGLWTAWSSSGKQIRLGIMRESRDPASLSFELSADEAELLAEDLWQRAQKIKQQEQGDNTCQP